MLKLPFLALAGALLLSTPLHAQTPLFPTSKIAAAAPGLRREAGTWLFNDSIFVASGANRGLIGGAVFLPHLRRDKKQKLPFFLPAKVGAPLNFSTLPLPTLRQINTPNFDFGLFDAGVAAQVKAARAAGEVYIGWSLSTGTLAGANPIARENAAALIKRIRTGLDAAAPDSALILQVETGANPALAALDIDAAAPSCDAVLLEIPTANRDALWPLKMARRVAEEQRDFDLPIFVAPQIDANTPGQSASDARMLEMWMGGATGFVMGNAPIPGWASAISRNPGLFAGAVTLEDAAIWPTLNPRTTQLIHQLRAAGRVPLAGRLPDEKRDSSGESLLAILDDQTTLETLNGLDKAARAGNAIYLEGLPNLKNPALAAKIGEMSGTTLEILPAPKTEVLTLSDAWLFGDARGREIGVSQRVKWTIKTSLAAQARKKKGEDVFEALSAARLAGDAGGLLVAPLGKGRLIWLAHSLVSAAADTPAHRDYYASIAGSLQGGLARLDFDSLEQARAGKITIALRASKTGTPIIALFNEGGSETTLNLRARGDAPIALDLSSERELAAKVSGYSSSLKVTVPARGYAWFSFGATRATLDKERLTPRPKAKSR